MSTGQTGLVHCRLSKVLLPRFTGEGPPHPPAPPEQPAAIVGVHFSAIVCVCVCVCDPCCRPVDDVVGDAGPSGIEGDEFRS